MQASIDAGQLTDCTTIVFFHLVIMINRIIGCSTSALVLGLALNSQQALAEVVSLPCFNFGGSGGLMFGKQHKGEEIPRHWFPLVVVEVQEYPLRSRKDHPYYNQEKPEGLYATCAVVPARYP